jgi:hypothetical protein
MINSSNIEKSFQSIYALMEKMPLQEREVLTDKLLSFLLFHNTLDARAAEKPVRRSHKRKSSVISKKDQELLKKIADKTDELYKRLGGDFI